MAFLRSSPLICLSRRMARTRLATPTQRVSDRSGVGSAPHTFERLARDHGIHAFDRTLPGEVDGFTVDGFTGQSSPPFALPRSMSVLPPQSKDPQVIWGEQVV
jgi:hypothetical protein